MKKNVENLNGILKISYSPFLDFRGSLIKLYRKEIFQEILPNIEELYISNSKYGVIRGLHFQLGNKGQDKFIYCISGNLLDVSVDLRPNENFGRIHLEELKGGSPFVLGIPGSFAHGVIILEENTTFINMTSQPYSPGDERGIRWDSLGIKFPIKDPIVSEKDKSWPSLEEILIKGECL